MATKTIKKDSLTLSTGQVAHMLGISEYLAQKLIRSGQIPSIRFGKIVRVPKAWLFKMVNGNDTCNVGGDSI